MDLGSAILSVQIHSMNFLRCVNTAVIGPDQGRLCLSDALDRGLPPVVSASSQSRQYACPVAPSPAARKEVVYVTGTYDVLRSYFDDLL